MSGRRRPPLPEALDVIPGEVVAAQVQQGVEQHGRMPDREDEPVTVQPIRVPGVVPQVPVEEDVARRRQRHGGARMPGLRLLHRVHGEDADRVDGKLLGTARLLDRAHR